MNSDLKTIKVRLVEHLIEYGCVKFGNFTLKSGIESPYYVDMRETTLHPKLFQETVESILAIIPRERKAQSWDDTINKPKTAIVGVPYGVVPIAAAVAFECRIVYYPIRKEVKTYGHKTDTSLCDDYEFILIEDVMSSGSSIIETVKKLDGRKVTDVIVLVDREMGGEQNLKAQFPEINLHSLVKVSDLLKFKRE